MENFRWVARLLLVLATVACAPEDEEEDADPTPAPIPTPDLVGTGTRLTVVGDPGSVKGIFDPSFAVPTAGGLGVMSYSTVTATQQVFTRVASTTNGGVSWAYIRDVNFIDPTTITDPSLTVCGASTCPGELHHETTSLLLDSTDPDPARQFKVFAHTYFNDGDIHYAHGWMSLFTADEPHLTWTQTKLLGWNAAAPTSTTGVVQNANDIPGLEDCILLSEPGVTIVNDAILLATGCPMANGAIRVELLRSTDHGLTWTRAGTLVDDADAAALGAVSSKVNASSLLWDGTTLWLSVTPTSSEWDYDGCWIIEVEDPATASVARDATGRPIVSRFIDTTSSRFNGMCATDVGLPEWIMDQLDVGATDAFQIHRTGIAPP